MKDLRLSKESTVRQSKQAMKLVFCYTLCNIIQNNLKNRLKRHAIIASQSQTNDQTGQMQEYLKVLLAQVDDSKAMATRTKKRAYSLMGITNHISQLHSKQLDNYKNQLKTAGYTLVEGIDSLSLQQTRTVLITLIAYYREKGRDLAERLAACLKQGVEWQRMSQVVSLVVIDQALVGMEWVDELQIQKGKGKFSEELRKELMEVEREEEAFFEVMSKKVVR